MDSLLQGLPEKQRGILKKKGFPDWINPMLATLTEDYFNDKNWIYERKLDGVRLLAFKCGKDLSLKSRNNNEVTNTYPELAEALAEEPKEEFVADGEIVAFEGSRTSFSRLQNRIHISDPSEARKSSIPVYLYLFDLIFFAGYDLTGLELRIRKKLLKKALQFKEPVRFTPHRNEDGKSYLKEACRKNWEGIIAKDAASAYVGSRSTKWLKFKCTGRQELVIGGFTGPKGSRIGFGALLLGYYEEEKFRYAGQVGTGFDDHQLKELHEKLTALERETNPFDDNDIDSKNVRWVNPKLIAEIGFTEWTNDNKLRHPRFLGLRTDKKPENIHKEKFG